MRFYAENHKGEDIFYVEIQNCSGYGNFIEISLPKTVFHLPDVKCLVRSIFSCPFNTTTMLKYVEQLISLLKSKGELTGFYFQDIELKSNNKFNSEQSIIMNELLLNQPIPYLKLITIESSPFLFRFICRELYVHNKSHLINLSHENIEWHLSPKIILTEMKNSSSIYPISYELQELNSQFEVIYLLISHIGKHPNAFYFIKS
jgi:hypothetical protein